MLRFAARRDDCGRCYTGAQADGLNAPELALFRQLKAAVDRAYPAPAAKP